ncbi:hypothetical protein K470DRAFT_272406 [Piedraia hortae CBS 480.64]|uniref:Uncharacterized protein n=1 Tax=Piedraia hortae CBS 480.64 TaxID=1314780 RepID=A0A6A7BT12_9PEZI|nr:hypothetical protein K470DRAFT_272406 [Piedraia hortae CBS 480.64]
MSSPTYIISAGQNHMLTKRNEFPAGTIILPLILIFVIALFVSLGLYIKTKERRAEKAIKQRRKALEEGREARNMKRLSVRFQEWLGEKAVVEMPEMPQTVHGGKERVR